MSTNGKSTDWATTPAGQQLKAHLSEERTLTAIDKLVGRLDTIEQAVEKLSEAMHQGPGMAAMAADIADEAYREADTQGVNIDERLKNALTLAEKLTSNDMLEKLDQLMAFARQAPGLAAMVADVADEAYKKADEHGLNIDERISLALKAGDKLTEPEMIKKLDQLITTSKQVPGLVAMGTDIVDESIKRAMDNGLDPHTILQVAESAGEALSQARQEPPAKVGGIFGLLRALNDKDRQRGLGFLLNFLKHFGSKL